MMSLAERLAQPRKLTALGHQSVRRPSGATTSSLDSASVIDDVHADLLNRLGERLYGGELDAESLENEVLASTTAVLTTQDRPLSSVDRASLVQQITDSILGHGPIEPLLRDPDVSEIMVNGHDQVFVERHGRIERSDVRFRDDAHLRREIDRIVGRVGRRIDEASPMVDARLPDGSRVNAVIPPIALDGSTLTIRKFAVDPFTVRDLVTFGTLTRAAVELLEACVRGRLNIIISGGTGSGKTTTLNVLSSFIPEDERIVTVEDAAELQLHQPHVIRLESRPANIEGSGLVTIRDLVRNALRMRPDRIVVGEVRDAAALDMLQAMNTGHDGSLTTVHANSPRDALARVETLVLMAGMELPVKVIREQIASAVNLVVHQSRLRDGTRHVTHISELVGMEGETILMQDLFVCDRSDGNDGRLVPTGVVPRFTGRLEHRGQVR